MITAVLATDPLLLMFVLPSLGIAGGSVALLFAASK